MLQQALGPVMIPPLIDITADYRCGRHPQGQGFAGELYLELWEGKTKLLYGELFDVEKGALKEPHHFWDYLLHSVERVVALLHMINQTRSRRPELKEELEKFALLVGQRVPHAAFFVRSYLDFSKKLAMTTDMSFPLESTRLGEWPQGLVEDPIRLSPAVRLMFGYVAALQYFLMLGNLGYATRYSLKIVCALDIWFKVLHILYAVSPFLVRRFFYAILVLDPGMRKFMFDRTAPLIMTMVPALSPDLVTIARENGWPEPVPQPLDMQAELADNPKAGGNVHVVPLTLIDRTGIGFGCRSSSTRKTVAHVGMMQLHVAAGNFLCALSTCKRQYLYVRNFDQAKSRRGVLVPGCPLEVKVQHGDVVVVHDSAVCPSFLEANVDCTGLSGEDCLERIKLFCYSAKAKDVYFMATVQSDSLLRNEGAFFGARNASAVKAARDDGKQRRDKRAERRSKKTESVLGKQQPSRKRKLERKGTKNGGQDELQES